MRTKRWIVIALESGCHVVDQAPGWTYPVLGRWLGCPRGLALLAFRLADRWGVEV